MSKLNKERENNLSQEALKEKLHYNPATGLFKWKITRGRVRRGAVAGSFDAQGYCVIGLNGAFHRAHRLAFLYMIGQWPAQFVDHVDGNPRNNRWENLREATKQNNALNKKMNARNTTGWIGVSFNKIVGKYQAIITKDGVTKTIGYYVCPEEAGLAREKAAKELFGEWAREAA